MPLGFKYEGGRLSGAFVYRPPNRWDFLNDVAFRTLGAGDDRTAVALWRIDVSPSYGEISVGYSKSY